MRTGDQLPPGVELVRVTDLFDEHHHPAGLRRAHRVADGAWARLVVRAGSLRFVFEDAAGDVATVDAGEWVVIPPGRLHHVDIDAPVAFVIEFHRELDVIHEEGSESTGLTAS